MPPVLTWNEATESRFGLDRFGSATTALLGSGDPEEKNRWNELIINRLLVWQGQSIDAFEEDVVPPSQVAVEVALEKAWQWRDRGSRSPENMILNRDGGILFLRCDKRGNYQLTIEISEDGAVDYLLFVGPRLVQRQRAAGAPRY